MNRNVPAYLTCVLKHTRVRPLRTHSWRGHIERLTVPAKPWTLQFLFRQMYHYRDSCHGLQLALLAHSKLPEDFDGITTDTQAGKLLQQSGMILLLRLFTLRTKPGVSMMVRLGQWEYSALITIGLEETALLDFFKSASVRDFMVSAIDDAETIGLP